MVPVVELSNITFRRGVTQILAGIDLQISDQQRWVVVGPNGAGKTTLFNIMAANSHPTAGTAKILGERLGAVDVFELRPRIGYVSSKVGEYFPDGERVLDVVLTATYAITGRWQEHYESADVVRAHSLLTQFGINALAERTFATLSDGEKKRALIARALMPNPELLLLDEPASGLDLAGREVLLKQLNQLCADPTSPILVVVTHHLEEIPTGATHALLLAKGGVVASGPIDSVITSDLISLAYGMNINVTKDAGRFFARASDGAS